MSNDELLARIDENVKFLVNARKEDRKAFDDHVKHDERVVTEYLKPLWEDRIEAIGAKKVRNMGGVIIDKAATLLIAIGGTWAAFKALK